MQVGDLVKYVDYIPATPVVHVGLVIAIGQNMGWNDIKVFTGGYEDYWVSWQCEVMNESR